MGMMRSRLALALFLLASVPALACSGDKDPSPPSAATVGAAPSGIPVPSSTRNEDLTLVYIDTSKGQGVEVYAAAFDGTGPRLLTTLPNGTRALDFAGSSLAAASQRQITLVDLKGGAVRNVSTANLVRDGRFVDANTLVYTTFAGCGPPNDSKTTLTRLDVRSLQQTELAAPDQRGLNISGVDATLGQVAVALRGCDVAVKDIAVYNLSDGRQASTISADGCGWALTALALKKALVSWQFCSGGKANTDVTLLDLSTTPPSTKDLKAPAGGANLHEFRLRPGQPQAALGTQMPGTPGPGFKATPTGLWLLDLNSGNFSNLAPADGLEQYPVAWSQDGRLLLAATVRAMGLCDYAAIDVTSKQVTPLSKSLTLCGANGDLLGWTVLR